MFCSNARRILFWNRILTRIQLFDVLKTPILITKGFPILLLISNMFQTKPYNEGYIYCVPFILLTIYFNYKFNIKSIAFPNVKSNLVEQKLKKVVN